MRPPTLSVTAPTPADVDAVENEQLLSQPQNVRFAKEGDEAYDALPARISRIFIPFFSTEFGALNTLRFARSGLFYINAYGHEIHPSPNPEFLSQLGGRDVLVYSCGSLWTRCVASSPTGDSYRILKTRTLVRHLALCPAWPCGASHLLLRVRSR
jgi:hypothetical protein